jgi:dethiobiotin synthetase
MKVFVTGTDTNVGKTLISSWLCYHLNYAYWKPIQTGTQEGSDSEFILNTNNNINHSIKVFQERYRFKEPVSPHFAARLNHTEIKLDSINVPDNTDLIIEGAGGVLVPLNQNAFMIDLIKFFKIPAIVVARSGLGTLNHSLLTIQALRQRNIPILGMILNYYLDSDLEKENIKSLEYYSQVPVLACFPKVDEFKPNRIKEIKMPDRLKEVFIKS